MRVLWAMFCDQVSDAIIEYAIRVSSDCTISYLMFPSQWIQYIIVIVAILKIDW